MLCGPPGAGKTTLAHVIARKCGYNPIEINASDDRSASKLKERVENATQMQSVWGDCRPNLVILDEIDGVQGGSETQVCSLALRFRVACACFGLMQGAVRMLLNMLKSSESAARFEGASPNKRKRKRSSRPINRPIICICNDKFVFCLHVCCSLIVDALVGLGLLQMVCGSSTVARRCQDV